MINTTSITLFCIVKEQYLKENVYMSSFNQRKWKKTYQIEVFQYVHTPDDFLEHYLKTLLHVSVIHIPFRKILFCSCILEVYLNSNNHQANKQTKTIRRK